MLKIIVPAMIITLVCAQAQNVKVITGATLIDGTGRKPFRDAVVVIEGARIKQVGAKGKTKIPAAATVIDAQGKFIIPGLADMHNHMLSGRPQQDLKRNLSRLLGFGVTTVFNPSIGLKEFGEIKAATRGDVAPYPRFFGAGPIIAVKGDFLGAAVGGPTPETADEARAAVKQLKAAGVDAVKAMRDDLSWFTTTRPPAMRLEVLEAIIEEAHRQNLKVYVHAPILKLATEALRAGADGLMHGIIDEPVGDEFIRLMKLNRAVYIATLSLFEDVADIPGWMQRQAALDERRLYPPAVFESFSNPAALQRWESLANNAAFTKGHLPILRSNLKKVFDSGVPIVMGTDAGFPGVLLGLSSHAELVLLVEAGLNPEDAIQTATINAARMLGVERELGTVEAGKLADMVVLDENPLTDICNIRRVFRVVKGGVVYDPTELFRLSIQ